MDDSITVEELKAEQDAGTFDPARWNWCVSNELRPQRGGGYKWEWSIWIMGSGAEQLFGVVWCADEKEAYDICRKFGTTEPSRGVS